MKFKMIPAMVLALFMVVGAAMAEPLTEADKKWSKVVEEMIVEGPTTISTPLKHRAELAEKLAKKHGRKSKIVKSGDTFKIVVS